MTDADGNQTIGFMDKLGRSVLSRSADPSGTQKADTYSLYDNKGRITHTLPPQTTITTSNLIYSYRYDAADNLTDLKQPDADWVKIWYNNKDLPALYQDGNMRLSPQKYLATNYDAYGREINTGFVGSIPSDLGSISFSSTEDVMSELIYGTTTETNPIRKVSLLQARYKTLTFDGNNNLVLGTNFFYDSYGRVSYTLSNDSWLSSTYDERMDYTYDMRDNVLSQIYSQNVNSAPKTFKHTWTYDTWDRMTDYFLNPTTSTDNGQQIAHYDYDLRGRLTQRNLGKYGTSSNWLQILNYTYNELDWLTAINPQGSSGLGTTQALNEPLGIPTPGAPTAPSADPQANDLFFLELKYYDPYANLDVPAISRKSGDISQVWWRARGRNREGYGLTYDYLGRMTKAQHVRLADGSSPTTPGARIINNYSEQLEYADQRGNIARILRYGMNYTSSTQAGSGVIDDLQFITEPGRNRIQRINEQASDLVFKLKGFRPKTEANGTTSTGGIDYSYDANGNQTSDPHKGITSIQYNYLNLPSLVTYADGRKIEQRYDAAGNLASRLMTGDASTPANNYFQVYVHGTEYRGSTIESVAHQEGRLFRSGGSNSSPVWRYEYSISDHLGNTRLTFADKTPDGVIKVEDGEVLEEAHYYPFGLAMEGPWMNDAAALDNRYKFNGIERVQDFGLNVDMAMYRAYDPAIGRWWQIDPMAAMAPELTPYRFGFNSPMNFSDPFGLFETRKEAREYKRENDVEGRVRRQEDGSFAIENKKDNSIKYEYKDADGFKSVLTGYIKTERGLHLADIGASGLSDLTNPYLEGYNPDAVLINDFEDRLYYLGSMLGVVSPSGKLASVSTVSKGGDDLITIYRGVNSTAGQAYENALKGGVKPRGGFWGHTNPYTHNKVAGGTVNSKFTSWTLDKDVALNYAFRGSGEGILFEMKIHKSRLVASPNTKDIQLIQNKSKFVSESEVLLKGAYRNIFFQQVKL